MLQTDANDVAILDPLTRPRNIAGNQAAPSNEGQAQGKEEGLSSTHVRKTANLTNSFLSRTGCDKVALASSRLSASALRPVGPLAAPTTAQVESGLSAFGLPRGFLRTLGLDCFVGSRLRISVVTALLDNGPEGVLFADHARQPAFAIIGEADMAAAAKAVAVPGDDLQLDVVVAVDMEPVEALQLVVAQPIRGRRPRLDDERRRPAPPSFARPSA